MKKIIIITISIAVAVAITGGAYILFQKNDTAFDFGNEKKDKDNQEKNLSIGPSLPSDFLQFDLGATESPEKERIFAAVNELKLEKIEIDVPEKKLEAASSSLELEMPAVKPEVKIQGAN